MMLATCVIGWVNEREYWMNAWTSRETSFSRDLDAASTPMAT